MPERIEDGTIAEQARRIVERLVAIEQWFEAGEVAAALRDSPETDAERGLPRAVLEATGATLRALLEAPSDADARAIVAALPTDARAPFIRATHRFRAHTRRARSH